jgi:hypothetical protein
MPALPGGNRLRNCAKASQPDHFAALGTIEARDSISGLLFLRRRMKKCPARCPLRDWLDRFGKMGKTYRPFPFFVKCEKWRRLYCIPDRQVAEC